MSAAAQRQAVQAAPSVVAHSLGLMALRRSCRCDSGDSAPEREDGAWRLRRLQRKLAIGATDDPLEREADLVAARVLAAPHPGDAPVRIGRQVATSAGPAVAPPSVQAALDGPGVPIEPAVREDMEQRIGHDFAHVRVHLDPSAARSASEVNARAYTVGRHIVFGPGHYAPRRAQGRALLGHELAHVVQQSGSAAPAVRRAVMQLGELTISIDYGGVATVAPADRPDRIIALATGLTGSAPDAAQETTIRALSSTAQVWLMFALDLLEDNSAAATGLDKAVAVQRLLNHAPSAANKPLPDPDRLFVREALRVSGWSETALAERLPAPSAAKRKKVREIVNPTPTSGSATDPLDVAALKKRLPPALKHLLKTIDPASWTSIGKRSISAFQKLGDIVQAEARTFFAPYADTAIGNLYDLKPAWHASANIFDVGALAPDRNMRLGYLRNRAEIVGRSDATSTAISDANIFADVNFDPTRTADDAELFAIVDAMEKDKAVQPIVDRLIQHTGRQSGTGAAATIGLVTEFNAAKMTACKDHWQGIDTLCHEVLHALVHPKFVATARKVSFPQVIREGFTEVLGVQLFNDGVVPKAASDAKFKASLEAGVSGAPCPAPAKATIGYGAAGAGAETIRNEVKDDRFRAAYFLGRPDLAGLPT